MFRRLQRLPVQFLVALCIASFFALSCSGSTPTAPAQPAAGGAAAQPAAEGGYPTGPIKLTFLMGRDVTRRQLFDNVWIPEYTKLHPNVTIELEQVPEVDPKMVVELATNGAPMVFEGNLATMQLFIEPLILANGAGAEDSATSVAYLIYQHGFFQNDLNGAAALGVVMLVVLAGFSAVYVRLTSKQEG